MSEQQLPAITPRAERRRGPDWRLGRRRSDAWFPYNPAFVVQVLAQSAADSAPGAPAAGIRAYGAAAMVPQPAVQRGAGVTPREV